jgi:oligopeptide/dipeptide ABC transporter ATP-binding protein
MEAPAAGAETPPVLAVDGLATEFVGGAASVRAVDGVSFAVSSGRIHGIVGESGSGKTALALSIARLLPPRIGRIVAGRIAIDGRDVSALPHREFRAMRGRSIGFVFQDPMTSLNPTLTVGEQIAEPMREHLGLGRRVAWDRAVELMERVGIRSPAARARDYPHQLSGGMRQRIMIAIALACRPRLLIADEPTTALDVTIQAQILDLVLELSDAEGTAVILITHDLGVAARMCDTISVMYAGRFVENGGVDEIFGRPQMPYTMGLLGSIPRLGMRGRLTAIPGALPRLDAGGVGCRFAPRCPHRREVCDATEPALAPRAPRHTARCWGTELDGWIP